MDQERLRRVANGGILHFRVEGYVDGFLQIGGPVHVHVANSFAVAEHGDAAMFHDVIHEFVRPARDDQVHIAIERQQLEHILARLQQLD